MKRSNLILAAAVTMIGSIGVFAFTSHSQKRGQGDLFTNEAGTCTLVDCTQKNQGLGQCDPQFTYFPTLTDCQNSTNAITSTVFATAQ